MTTDGGASRGELAWLSADDIAALSNGQATAGTVRSWWRKGLLSYEVFPELGAKSNKRSPRIAVEQFLNRKYGQHFGAAGADPTPLAQPLPYPTQPTVPVPGNPSIADLIDTLSSVKAGADSIMQALINEAETHAAFTRAVADEAAKRLETLKLLQTTFRSYDLALSTHIQPAAPDGLGGAGL